MGRYNGTGPNAITREADACSRAANCKGLPYGTLVAKAWGTASSEDKREIEASYSL